MTTSNETILNKLNIMNKETITVSANQSKRTFTIRKEYSDGFKVKYRTVQMSQEDFDSEERNTQKDWRNFLNSSCDYYKV